MLKKFILNAILINICLFSYITLLVGFITIKNIPTFLIILISIIFLISLIIIVYCYLNKHNLIYNMGIVLTIIITITCLFNINNLNNTYSYLENIYSKKYKYDTYEVYVHKSTTTYNNLTKLEGKKIGMLSKNSLNVKKYLNNVSNIEYMTYDTSDELLNALKNYEVQSIIISDEDYQNLNNDDKYKSKLTSIYEGKIKTLNNF